MTTTQNFLFIFKPQTSLLLLNYQLYKDLLELIELPLLITIITKSLLKKFILITNIHFYNQKGGSHTSSTIELRELYFINL